MKRAAKRGSGGRDRWRGGTKEKKWCDYEDLVRRRLHRHIHVHVTCQSTVFVAPKAGVLHSHLSLGIRPHTHTHTVSWLIIQTFGYFFPWDKTLYWMILFNVPWGSGHPEDTHTYICAPTHTHARTNKHTLELWLLSSADIAFVPEPCLCLLSVSLFSSFLMFFFPPSNPRSSCWQITRNYKHYMIKCHCVVNDDDDDCCFISPTKHSHDVIVNVSGVAKTQVPGASINTAPFRSLSLTDHSTATVLLSLLYFGQNTRKCGYTNRLSGLHKLWCISTYCQLCTNNLMCTHSIKTTILLCKYFGVVLLLHLGVRMHIMINWRQAWSIQCISAVVTEAWGRSKSSL